MGERLMTKGLIGLTLIAVVSCGKVEKETVIETVVVTKIEPCSAAPDPEGNGVFLMCGDMDPVLIENGKDGLNGANGADGEDGIDGQDGANGNNASIKLVTPCPELGVPQDYPEALVCINEEELFAVYSPNGSAKFVRLTPLLEGAVYSTTDGRSCTFKVGLQCQLSY